MLPSRVTGGDIFFRCIAELHIPAVIMCVVTLSMVVSAAMRTRQGQSELVEAATISTQEIIKNKSKATSSRTTTMKFTNVIIVAAAMATSAVATNVRGLVGVRGGCSVVYH